MELTSVQKEAVMLRFRAQNPDAPPDAAPTPEQTERLLLEMKELEAEGERNALNVLRRHTDNPKSYSSNRSRYAQAALVFLIGLAVVAGALYGLAELISVLLAHHPF